MGKRVVIKKGTTISHKRQTRASGGWAGPNTHITPKKDRILDAIENLIFVAKY
jgi:hypothetical protein